MKLIFKDDVIDYNAAVGFSPSGSLTPRNNKSKKEFSFEKEEEMQEDTIAGYVYTYSNKWAFSEQDEGVEIKHYSIDPASTKNSVEEFNSNLPLQQQLIVTGKEPKKNNTKTTSYKSGAYKADDDKKLLHECETTLINTALEALSTEKVVLIDIFAREDSGKVKFQSDGFPETHTIILCKGNASKILVIDPNNSSFSSHLATQYNKGAGLEVAPSLCKIYQPVNKDSIGTSINSSRDCIDIAIKLAYKLSDLDSEKISFKSNSPEIFTTNEMKDIVKDISNNSKYDDTIDELVRNEQCFLMIPGRLKQVTQDGYGKEFYDDEIENIKIISSKLNKLLSYDGILSNWDEVIESCRDVLKGKQGNLNKVSLKYNDYIESRKNLSQTISKLYSKYFPDQKKDSQSDIQFLEEVISDLKITDITPEAHFYTQDVSFSGVLSDYDSYMEL